MGRALVTGANGHLGSNLVRALVDAGVDVVPFVRKSADLRAIAPLGLTCRYGDVLDAASVDQAIEGCDTIFHCAAVYATRGDPEEIIRPAVDGARHVYAAAARHGVKRIVYTSSIAAIGFAERIDRPRTEKDWNESPVNAYYRAKTDSEREVWRLAESTGIATVVLNPAQILGPLDLRITPSTGYVRDLLNGTSSIVRGATNLVAVEDVARAHVVAAERGRPGERYLVAGDNLRFEEVAGLAEALGGKKNARALFPRWVVMGYVGATELVAKATGKSPSTTTDQASEVVDRYAVFDTTKLRAELGIEPQGAREVVARTARWLAHWGALDADVAARVRDQLGAGDPSWPSPEPTPPGS